MRSLVLGLVLVVSLVTTTNADAQVVFKGPTEAKPNKMTTITLEKVEGNDLKLQGFIDGKPADASEWLLMKNLDNQIVIFLMTERQAVFTFVAAVNKDNKTFLSNHTITIGTPQPQPKPPEPTPPTPPTPGPQTFGEKLKTAYKVSPDAPSLTKLILILEEVNKQNFANYDQMETVLAATGKRYLPNAELQKLRDMIGDEILAKCGENPAKRDIAKVKEVLSEAITALKGV